MLGLHDIERLANKPMRVLFPDIMINNVLRPTPAIHRISCGTDHCLAVDDLGILYAWGMNKNGVLGIAQNHENLDKRVVNPQVVEIIKEAKIVDCHAGHTASFVTNLRGKVFYWGK